MRSILMYGIDDLVSICVKSARHLRKLIRVPGVREFVSFKADDPVAQTDAPVLPIDRRDCLHFLRCILRMYCKAVNIGIRCLICTHNVIQQLLIGKRVRTGSVFSSRMRRSPKNATAQADSL